MRAESSSTPMKYITFAQLVADVREDLRMYDENNMIDDTRLLKHVIRCSEFLGERMHQSKQCKISVLNFKAPIPTDMWKIENMYGVSESNNDILYFQGIFGGGMIFHDENELSPIPSPSERIQYLGIIPNDCCKPMHVSAYDSNYFERVESKKTFPLVMSTQLNNKCTNYAACNTWQQGYQVDLQEDEFTFSFKNGEVFLSYLGDLVNSDGDLLVPDNENILPFYEWTLKKVIFEDLFMNSEADVQNKYSLAQRNLIDAKVAAMDYVNAFKGGQLDHLSRKRKMNFYNDWYKKFDM